MLTLQCIIVFSALDVFSVGEFKRFYDNICQNLRELSCLFYVSTNTTLNRLRFGNSYILSAFDE